MAFGMHTDVSTDKRTMKRILADNIVKIDILGSMVRNQVGKTNRIKRIVLLRANIYALHPLISDRILPLSPEFRLFFRLTFGFEFG